MAKIIPISKDDPRAIEKLRAKIEHESLLCDFMVAANKIVRRAHKAGAREDTPLPENVNTQYTGGRVPDASTALVDARDAFADLRAEFGFGKMPAETCEVERSIARKRAALSVLRSLLRPDFAGRIGFPGYEMSNRRANVKRMEARIEEIERYQSEKLRREADARYRERERNDTLDLF